MQGPLALSLLASLELAAAVTLRGSQLRRNATDGDVLVADAQLLNGTTAWDTSLVVQRDQHAAPHAVNEECSTQLGAYWTLPQSDVSVRHNLIPGATIIFEVGGNIGEDLEQYAWRFPSAWIYSYEPVPELFNTLQQKFGSNPNIKLTQVGVSNYDHETTFTVGGNHGEGSSHTNTSAYGQTITVQLRDAHALLTQVQSETGKAPDVVSINCEGCEYDVLSRMAQTGWLGRVPFVQLSWHVVGGVANRLGARCAIEKVLWQHYDPAYHALYGWQGWKLKGAASLLQEDDGEDDGVAADDAADEEQSDDEQSSGDVSEEDGESSDDVSEESSEEQDVEQESDGGVDQSDDAEVDVDDAAVGDDAEDVGQEDEAAQEAETDDE